MSSRVRSVEDTDDTFQFDDAINYLLKDAGAKKMHGNVRLPLALDAVESSAREHGLTGEAMTTVVDIITKRNLSITATNRLIKSLLPRGLVPVAAALRCVSWLCTMKPPASVQGLLIRWMVLMYDLIDDKDIFHAVYTVFFHFLQYEAMCPHVCHLLYLMTRKNDVKVFRVRTLLKLQERMGVQPYILGLLSLYKIYSPHLVSLSIPKRKRVFFHRADASWQMALQKVHRSQTDSGHTSTANGSPGSYSRMAAKTKRRRHELIPSVDIVMTSDVTAMKPGLLSQQIDVLVPFSQIRSFTHLLSNLDRLELPSQMAAVLTDRNLQHVLRCHPDTAICTRLVFWLDHALTHELLNDADGETERGEQLLMMLIAVSDFLKEGLPVCELFLERFLHVWNGRDYRVYILKLITRCRLRPFTSLNELLLEPLRKLMFCSSVFVKCQILICFTDLLRNFVSIEWPRYKSSENSPTQGLDESDHFSVFSDTEVLSGESFHPLDTITSFIEFVDSVSMVALRQEREHILLHHCVLSFYELVSSMHQAYDVPVAPVLSRELFYRCLFCDHATILMRLCDVMCSYRNAYQAIRHLKTSSASSERLIDHIKTFNLYIVDMCDTLWRSRAFSGSEKHPQSVFHLLGRISPSTQLSAKHSFSLSQHPAMLGLAIRFLAQKFPDTTQVQPKLIRQNIDSYLEFLEARHMPGMMNFVKLFIQRHSSSQSRLSTTSGHS